MPVYELSDELVFPHPKLAESDGLLAVGGDLCVDRLILAYMNGIFPWFNEDDPILWWAPKSRYVIFPEKIHISKSMKRLINKVERGEEFQVTYNKDFRKVIRACGDIRRNKDGTWITEDMIEAYCKLHEEGYAESVEVWYEGKLVGGIYGVVIGRCFFGESMFSTMSNTSKLALIYLCKVLEEEGFKFLDCQFHTNHLESMGGEEIDFEKYYKYIEEGLE